MNLSRVLPYVALVYLSACALTPEQRAAREAEQKRYEQMLQVKLAEQCDPATAQIMQQFFDDTAADNATRQQNRLQYVEKINDPMFQACYKMAWQNYRAQQELRRMQRYYDWRDPFYPWHRPFGWWY